MNVSCEQSWGGPDSAAFENLAKRHMPRVRRAVRTVLRNPSDVDDVVQQALLRALTRMRSLQQPDAFATWLTQIAVNEARMHARHLRVAGVRLDVGIDALPSSVDGPERRAAAREEMALVRRAAHRLPLRHREMLGMRYGDDLSVTQTAAALGITKAAVRVRHHRARLALLRAVARELPRPSMLAWSRGVSPRGA